MEFVEPSGLRANNINEDMYNFIIPKKLLEDLWRLREYAGRGSIAGQIRQAISDYIGSQKDEIKEIEKAIRQQEQGAERD